MSRFGKGPQMFDAIQVLAQYRDGLLTRDEAEKYLKLADSSVSVKGWRDLLDFLDNIPDLIEGR